MRRPRASASWWRSSVETLDELFVACSQGGAGRLHGVSIPLPFVFQADRPRDDWDFGARATHAGPACG